MDDEKKPTYEELEAEVERLRLENHGLQDELLLRSLMFGRHERAGIVTWTPPKDWPMHGGLGMSQGAAAKLARNYKRKK